MAIGLSPETISDVFARYAEKAAGSRAHDILVALARHLHAFVRETGLTHEEWRAGLAALTRAGEISSETRNEFVLFSDMFGVSSLVDMINTPAGATSSSVLGPFHQRGAADLPNGGDLWKKQPGEVLLIVGRVVDADGGEGVPCATLDLWQNADNGLYSAQDPDQHEKNYHGLLRCGDDGRFAFTTTRFKPYTVPYDGPAGDMLRLLGRTAWRPAHLHLIAEAPGYRPIVTEFFPSDDEWLAQDAAFGVRDDLVLTLNSVDEAVDVPVPLVAGDRLPARFMRADVTIRMTRRPEKRKK